jgi:hypothetical protein
VSHYLQRLASSALKPSGNIHPVLAATFSTSKRPFEVEAPRIEEDMVNAQNRVSRGQASTEESLVSPAPAMVAMEQQKPRAPATVVDETELVHTLPEPELPKPLTPTHVSSGRNAAATKPPGQDAVRASSGGYRSVPANTPHHKEIESQANRSEDAYTPLIAEHFSPLTPTVTSPKRHPFQAASGWERKPDKASPSQRSGASVREPDEIQIHIGRIEVTAAQPAMQRPTAAQPRRLAPSLAEYLRRRDRRPS